MLDLDTTNSSFQSLLAFKPRQLLIAQRNPPPTTMPASASKITPEMKVGLHQVILDYFHRNGFSKTLKRFHSEALIQTDSWKASSLHLEDIFYKHNACNGDSNKNTSKKPGNDEAMEKDDACPTNVVTTTKKKKKKAIVDGQDCAIKDESEVTDKKIKESSKNMGQISKDIIVDEPETQPKKKKTKHGLVSSTDDVINELNIEDLTKKSKEKKKKNIEEVKLEPSITNENKQVTETEQKEKKKKKKQHTDENGTIQPDVTKKEKKRSKKRKRSFSDDDDENENENGSTKEEINAQETSNKHLDGETNGKLETDGVKSKKKQRNVTTEPKTVNAFQRVKMDEVEFAHDKLQDNSYWAKDGAEIGYGAKAQEVLGQVRGRDFRHEKTKKKRGSYRGGLIDQQSHSIKFNYSDEE